MRVIEFSRLATFCVTAVLCAEAASAQTCQSQQRKQVSVGGYYSFSASGNGAPGSLVATGGNGTSTAPPFSSTEVGQLLNGLGNPGPFASFGMLFLDSARNILASSTTQQGVTTVVGSYTLNSSDCTITVTLRDAFGTNTSAANLQGIVLRDGSEIDLGVLQNYTTGTVCTGSTTGTCAAAPATPSVNSLYGSNTLVRLVRQQSPSCKLNSLFGPYALLGNGNRVATIAGGTVLGAQTQAPFFTMGLVQFDGNGGIASQAGPSSLAYLQFVGTYTVNGDCTGTMTLSNAPNALTGGVITPPIVGATLNFVLIQSIDSGSSELPVISFSQSGSGQTLFGTGIAQ